MSVTNTYTYQGYSIPVRSTDTISTLSIISGRERCIELLRGASPYIRSEFGVKSMQMFGSTARGEDNRQSDVDIFVDMPPKALKLVGLKQYLQTLLGRAVDIVRSHSHLDPFLTNEIKRDGITIFTE